MTTSPASFTLLGGAVAASSARRATHANDLANTEMRLAGVTMPRILYGTAWKEGRTKEICQMALRAGFRGFDTACQPKHYNQKGLGEALEAECAQLHIKREDLFIQTKYTPLGGQDPQSIPYDPRLPVRKQVLSSMEVSAGCLP